MMIFSSPPQKSAILTTVGVLEQPLGNARLHVARLVAALLQTSDPSICQGLCNLSTMDVLLVNLALFDCLLSVCAWGLGMDGCFSFHAFVKAHFSWLCVLKLR